MGLAFPVPAMSGAGAVDGLVHAARRRAERGGGQHADGAGELRRLVGEDVAEHVGGDDHVELPRRAHQLHGRVVHEHVRKRHIRVLRRHGVHRLAPQARALQHVRLVHAGHAAAALLRHGERRMGDALDLRAAVALGIERGLAVGPARAAALAKVDAAGELAHDHDVEPAAARLHAQRACVRQRGIEPRRAQVCVHAERLADAQQRLLRPQVAGQAVPPRAADRAEQHCVAVEAALHRLLGQRRARAVDGAAADVIGGKAEAAAAAAAHGLEHAHRGVHDLRADAVAPEQCDPVFLHASSFRQSPRAQPPRRARRAR